MSCSYCYRDFDLYDHKPMIVSCSHHFCIQCIKRLNRNLLKCPLDNLRVKFDQAKQSTEKLEELQSICKTHNLKLCILCKNHLIICCSGCISESHSDCKTIDENINQKIKKISQRISNLSIKFNKLKPSRDFNNLSQYRDKIKQLTQKIDQKVDDLQYFKHESKGDSRELNTLFPIDYSSVENIQKFQRKLNKLNEDLKVPFKQDEPGLNMTVARIFMSLGSNHLRLMKNIIQKAPNEQGYVINIKQNLYQHYENDLKIIGLGFGNPVAGSWFEIVSLQVNTTDTSSRYHFYELNSEYCMETQSIIKEIFFNKTLLSSPRENIAIVIILQGEGLCNLFQTSYYSQANVLNLDSNEFDEPIPILYLILS